MKNPFRRSSEVDRQIVALREIAAEMQRAAETVAIETSAPRLKQRLAELDPRLLDLLLDQSKYQTVLGFTELGAGSRERAVRGCRYAFDTNVQIANAARTWTDWGFGRVLDIHALDAAADSVWQECWTAARNRCIFGQRKLQDLSEQVLNDGELFFIGYTSRVDGTTTWRTLETLQVQEILHPAGDPAVNAWYIVDLNGQRVAIPDAFTYFAMRERVTGVTLPAGVTDFNRTPQAQESGGTFALIVAAQRNLDANGRGWPEFHLAIPWADVYAQMLREYSAVFSAVAMFVDKLKVQGGSRTVADLVTQLQSSLVTSAGYGETNPRPAAGSTWVENEAADRTRLPLGSAAGDAQAGTGFMALQLAVGLGVKASDVGRVDMFQNKATADIAAEGPQQRWQRYQLFWASVWGDIVETTLRLYQLFSAAQFANYAVEVSSTLPLNLDTAELVQALDALNKSTTTGTLPPDVATRAALALTELILLDLGVQDAANIVAPPGQREAAPALPAPLTESHVSVSVRRVCPLCGYNEAHSYAGHGALLVCAGCGKTYDPEIE